MTTHPTNDPAHHTPAATLEAEAADWLQRRHFWAWSEADEAQFNTWLAQSGAHRVTYWRLKAGFERSSRLTALNTQTSFGQPRPQAPKSRLHFFMGLAAASLALAALLGVSNFRLTSQNTGTLYETQVGGRQTIVLTDGSKIDLNTGTAVRVKGRSAQVLRGEAFFQITHDEKRPFIVTAGKHRIVDLGTQFSVRTRAKGLEVALIEGRARIDVPSTPSAHAAVLNPGDVAIATSEEISVSRKSQQDLSGELGWRRGVLVFQNTTLEAAAAEFNRYNRKKLVIAEPVAKLTIGATFPTDDVEAFARTAKNVFGLTVEHRGDDIMISK